MDRDIEAIGLGSRGSMTVSFPVPHPLVCELMVQRSTGFSFVTRTLHRVCSLKPSYSPLTLTQFAMAPSPKAWGTPLDMRTTEPDDYLHNPDPLRDRNIDRGGTICTARGVGNLGCLFILAAGCLMLLYVAFSYYFVKHSDQMDSVGYLILVLVCPLSSLQLNVNTVNLMVKSYYRLPNSFPLYQKAANDPRGI